MLRNAAIVDIRADGAGCVVTWLDADDAEQVTEVELEFERGDRSCGINTGWLAHGEAPEWVLSHAAEWASERARDQYEDAQW